MSGPPIVGEAEQRCRRLECWQPQCVSRSTRLVSSTFPLGLDGVARSPEERNPGGRTPPIAPSDDAASARSGVTPLLTM